MNKETMNALSELAKAAHKMMGGNENDPVEFTICLPKCLDCKHSDIDPNVPEILCAHPDRRKLGYSADYHTVSFMRNEPFCGRLADRFEANEPEQETNM